MNFNYRIGTVLKFVVIVIEEVHRKINPWVLLLEEKLELLYMCHGTQPAYDQYQQSSIGGST